MTIPDHAAAIVWCRRWAFTLGLAAVFVLALTVRLLLTLKTSGGLFGLGNYDDGVHFAAALGLVNGQLPYRDFLLLHPPGVVLALAPFAALSWLIGEPWAMAAARVSWMGLGALNAVLCGLALRPLGRLAGMIGALFYAVFLGAVYVEYTALLESPATTVMLAALVITRLIGPVTALGSRHYVAAGVLLGLSPVLKIWGVVTVLVIVGGILARRGRRQALLTLAAAVATTTAVCLPFFLSAPGQMWRMVVVAQLGRRREAVPLSDRLNDILGVRVWARGLPTWQPVTVVMLVAVLAVLAVCLVRAELRVVAALLIAHGAIVVVTPMWFLHYAGLTAAPIALAVGAAVGASVELGERRRAPWIGGLAGAVAVAGTVALAASLPRFNLGNADFPGRTMAAQIEQRPGCLATDWPMTLIQMDLLQRNLDRRCPLVVDIGGYSYYLVDSQYSDGSRRKNRDFQVVVLDYYRSADAVVPVRFSTLSGYDKATAKEIASWPVLAEVGRYVVRQPQPGAR